ncbi:hypothetical protein F7Q91_03510 [Vibrio chagasii]|uniref:Uncharacterized protein n=1 Tax=Vibrio chagasii TaxID=170679 RepID=A0A7V7TI23_9VIBR|nr:hypothetical protein [Vibrio chagasii]KAB0482490.1 hypothetical protein F7Q91_03510 [Vibrio chagasii]
MTEILKHTLTLNFPSAAVVESFMSDMDSNESVLNELISLGSLIDSEPSNEVEYYANLVLPKEYLVFDWNTSPIDSVSERKTRYSLELRRHSRFHKGLFHHVDSFNGADTKYARGLTKLINQYIALAVGYLRNRVGGIESDKSVSSIVSALHQINDSIKNMGIAPVFEPSTVGPQKDGEAGISESVDVNDFDMSSLLP